MNILYIAVGGALGSVFRYGLSSWLQEPWGTKFPAGTFSVNILGSLLIGLLFGLFSVNGIIDERLRMFVFIGFLGGFTTFSSFTFENISLIQSGAYITAACYILTSNIFGILAAFGGFYVGSALK